MTALMISIFIWFEELRLRWYVLKEKGCIIMTKRVRKTICMLVAVCMLMSVFCMTAFAESGTYNGKTYTISLSLSRRAMTSTLSYPDTIQLGFLGYGESSLGSGYAKVSCANSQRTTRVSKTVNPPNDSLQFYHAYQEYYCNSHYMQTVERNLSRL